MSDDFHTITTHLAAKAHLCEENGCEIRPGDRYHKWAGVQEGYFYTAKVCGPCRALRAHAWSVFDWGEDTAPPFGELYSALAEEDVSDPRAWLAAHLAAKAAEEARRRSGLSDLTRLPWLTKAFRRIYVASSWRNEFQQGVVSELRACGHEVYDFKNPADGQHGFAWSELDPHWQSWSPARFAELVQTHPRAREGFNYDRRALDWCDTCVLVLPCGRSAHLEAGYAAGQGKHVIWWMRPEKFEPELMYLLGHDFVVGTSAR